MSLSLYLVSKFLEQTMTGAPFLIASFINFSPLNLFPLMAKKNSFFLHLYYSMKVQKY